MGLFSTITGFVLNLTKSPTVAAIAGNALKGAVTGAVVGAAKAVITKGDPLKGALTGAAIGGTITGGLSAAGALTPLGSDAQTQLGNLGVSGSASATDTLSSATQDTPANLRPGTRGYQSMLGDAAFSTAEKTGETGLLQNIGGEQQGGGLLGNILGSKEAMGAVAGAGKAYMESETAEKQDEAAMARLKEQNEGAMERLQKSYQLEAEDRKKKQEENVVPDLTGNWWKTRTWFGEGAPNPFAKEVTA